MKSMSVEETIIRALQTGPITTTNLVERVDRERHGVTRQGVYRVLRKLKGEEKIVQHGTSVSLNVLWLKKMASFYSVAQRFYSPHQGGSGSFLDLKERGKILFRFNTLVELDVFASHAIHMLTEIMPADEPVYAFNPHEIFSYGRGEAEDDLLKALEDMHKNVYVLSAHETPLDRALRRHFMGSSVSYHIETQVPFDTRTYYFNVCGNFLLEIRLDKKISDEIETFYREHKRFDDTAVNKLSQIFSQQAHHRITISHNSRKTARYKKFFSKFF